MSSDKTKLGLTISVFVAMLLYHFGKVVTNDIIKPTGNLLDFIGFVQIAIGLTTFVLTIRSALVVRVLLGESFVSGKYECASILAKAVEDNLGYVVDSRKYIERFVIQQSLFETKISGESFLDKPDDKSVISTWEGTLYKVEGLTFFFGVDVSSNDRLTSGILRLSFHEDVVHGFYFSGDSRTPGQFNISGKRVQ